MKILTCKDASELISRQHETPLTMAEKFWLKLHLYLCDACRNFQNNTRLMRAALQRYLEQGKE